MPEYTGLLRFLVLGLVVLVAISLLTALMEDSFQSALVYSITILMLAMLILARFGGNRGETL